VALDATLTAAAPEKVTTRFAGASHRIEPGSVVPVLLQVKGPRMLTGTEADRGVTVDLVARRAHTIPAMDEDGAEPDLVDQTSVTLKQRPLISRGFLTFLILASIVAVWAAIFLLGLVQVFKGDPMTKSAPTSYFPASLTDPSGGASPSASPSPGAAGTTPAADQTTAPPGSTPKTGLLPPGVGGEIDGVVTAASNHAPVGRITVAAWRMGATGPVQVSSAATQSDGSYALAGLFPTTYWLEFTADGYAPVWYPGKPAGKIETTVATPQGSDQVMLTAAGGLSVGAQAKLDGTNVVVQGKPATISGRIDAGDTTQTPKVTVTATMVDGGGKSTRPHVVTTDKKGDYKLTGLTAPGTYELAFSAPGYQVTTQTETVDGGEDRLEPTMLLGAQNGTLTGTVTDGTNPLGGVTVSTTVAGKEVSVVTPTVGAVGTFTLDGLPTPGTYVITYAAKDHGTTTRIVAIAPGGSGNGDAVMTNGTGSVSGHLDDVHGHGLGGATVTVGGVSGQPPTTTTLTSGDVGAFTIVGLAAPGNYTLTFTADGYQPVTVPVTLATDAPVTAIHATVVNPQVSLYGEVRAPNGSAVQGATVVLTDGVQTWQTTSTGAGGNLPAAISGTGGYYFPAVDPGVYNVTVSADGYRQVTTRIDLTAVTSDPPSVQQGLQLAAVS